MTLRLAVLATVLVGGMFATGAEARDHLAFADIAGDANHVNDQETGAGDQSGYGYRVGNHNAGPSSSAAADITRVLVHSAPGPKTRGKATGRDLRVTVELGAPLAAGTAVRFGATVGSCRLVAETRLPRIGTASTVLEQTCPGLYGVPMTTRQELPAAQLDKATVGITVPAGMLPGRGASRTELRALRASSHQVLTVPSYYGTPQIDLNAVRTDLAETDQVFRIR